MRDWFKWISIALLGLGSSTFFSLSGDVNPEASRGAVQALERALDQAQPSWDVLAKTPFSKTALTRQDAERAEDLLAHAYLSRLRSERAQEMDENVLRIGDLSMPFFVAIYGEAPLMGGPCFFPCMVEEGLPRESTISNGKIKSGFTNLPRGFMWLPELLPILGTFGIRIISMTFSSV